MGKGLYIYGVIEGRKEDGPLGIKGIAGASVFAVSHGELAAVVQECDKPIETDDMKVVSELVLQHQAVVDLIWDEFDTVVPFSFGTIIVPKDGKPAMENLRDWMRQEGETLRKKLARLRGKAEYGVQISWDPEIVAPRITTHDEEIKKLEGEIRSNPPGKAYLLKQRLESLLRSRIETAADVYFKEFYQKIKTCVEGVQVEKVRKEEPPRQMLANLSCLGPKGEVSELEAALEKIGKIEGFFVRFTGPWPPYSFVNS